MPSCVIVPPVLQAGLHHHGEEEARAGYTVGELLALSRSSNSRQVGSLQGLVV